MGLKLYLEKLHRPRSCYFSWFQNYTELARERQIWSTDFEHHSLIQFFNMHCTPKWTKAILQVRIESLFIWPTYTVFAKRVKQAMKTSFKTTTIEKRDYHNRTEILNSTPLKWAAGKYWWTWRVGVWIGRFNQCDQAILVCQLVLVEVRFLPSYRKWETGVISFLMITFQK